MHVIPETKNQGFLIIFTKKLHFACFLAKDALDFVLHRLLSGLAEMDTDDIGGIARAEELKAATPGAVILQQFDNPANPAMHERTTGQEIWRDTEGHVDRCV